MHEGHCAHSDVSLTAYSGNLHTTDSHGESLQVVQEVSHGPKHGDSCDTIEAVKAILAEYADGQFEFAIVRSSEGRWVFGCASRGVPSKRGDGHRSTTSHKCGCDTILVNVFFRKAIGLYHFNHCIVLIIVSFTVLII